MQFGDRSDGELMELARAGWAPAFAVLVHRHAPLVHAAVADRPDPTAALVEVFTRAMRQLEHRDASAPVAPWLLDLAGSARPDAPRPLLPGELDELWARLHTRWPDGRRHADRQSVRGAALLAALVAVAAVVPAVFLGADEPTPEAELVELRAIPVPDERTVEVVEEPVEETPDFTFPEGPEEEEPPPPAPEPDPDPAPQEEEPPPATVEEPAPPPAGAEPDNEDTEDGDEVEDGDADDDGLLDDLVGPDDRTDEGEGAQAPDESDEADDA